MKKPPELLERSNQFAFRIVQFYRKIETDSVGRILGKQLLRSATSIGANLQEAQGGQSRADFISKISIAYKESRETIYWIRLIRESITLGNLDVNCLEQEAAELTKILASIIISSKRSSEEKIADTEEVYSFESKVRF